jgi:hypothetical protein
LAAPLSPRTTPSTCRTNRQQAGCHPNRYDSSHTTQTGRTRANNGDRTVKDSEETLRGRIRHRGWMRIHLLRREVFGKLLPWLMRDRVGKISMSSVHRRRVISVSILSDPGICVWLMLFAGEWYQAMGLAFLPHQEGTRNEQVSIGETSGNGGLGATSSAQRRIQGPSYGDLPTGSLNASRSSAQADDQLRDPGHFDLPQWPLALDHLHSWEDILKESSDKQVSLRSIIRHLVLMTMHHIQHR